jgi:hypothetical protein
MKGQFWSVTMLIDDVQEHYRHWARCGWFRPAEGSKIAIFGRQILSGIVELKRYVEAGLKFDVSGYGMAAGSTLSLGLQVSWYMSTHLDADMTACAK